MRKNILIYNYTTLSSEEIDYWNQLAFNLRSEGYFLFVLAQKKTQDNVFFDYYTFTEKLDHVRVTNFKAKDNFKDMSFQKYLDREELWSGASNNDRLSSAQYQKYLYEVLLDELNPCLVLLSNGEHAGDMILKDECISRKIPLTYLERGCLPKSWHLDDLGITAGTTIARKKIDEVDLKDKSSFLKYKEHYLSEKYTWWQQPEAEASESIREKFNLDAKVKIILFANQLDNDTSNFLYSPLHQSNAEAFGWFCDIISKEIKEDFFVLVKKHPWYMGDDNAFEEPLKKIRGAWVSNIDLFDCLGQCDLVCAVNSTLIYEAMIYQKPVLQIGKSILTHKDIVYEIKSLEDTRPINSWFYSDDFGKKLDLFERFMSYMIDEELSFFSKGCIELGFSGSDLLLKKILQRVDATRSGSFPIKFLEGRIDLEIKTGRLSIIQEDKIPTTSIQYLEKQPTKSLYLIFKKIIKILVKRTVNIQ